MMNGKMNKKIIKKQKLKKINVRSRIHYRDGKT